MPVPKYGHDGTDGMGEGTAGRDGRGGYAAVAGRGRGRIGRRSTMYDEAASTTRNAW